MQRDLQASPHLEHPEVVDLPHVRDAERRRERTLANPCTDAARLHVHHHIRARKRILDRILDAVCGRVPLPHGSPRRDADHHVREVRATGAPDAEPAQLDRRVERGDRLACGALGVDRRLVHEDVHVPAQEPDGGDDDEHRDEEGCDRVALRRAEVGRDQPGEDGDRPGEIAAEVERAGDERVAPVALPRPQRDEQARGVDRDDEGDCPERPDGRVDRERDDAQEPRNRGGRDEDADADQEPRLAEGSEVLRLCMPERMPAVGRSDRHRHREEGEERRGEIGSRVRSLRDEGEASAAEPGGELDRDQEAGGPDRDERRSPLRRHAQRLDGPSVEDGSTLSSPR